MHLAPSRIRRSDTAASMLERRADSLLVYGDGNDTWVMQVECEGRPNEERNEARVVAYLAGRRFFGEAILEAVFGGDLQMVREPSRVRGWLSGIHEQGKTEGERDALLTVLGARSASLSDSVVARGRSATPEWCHTMLQRAARANSLGGPSPWLSPAKGPPGNHRRPLAVPPDVDRDGSNPFNVPPEQRAPAGRGRWMKASHRAARESFPNER